MSRKLIAALLAFGALLTVIGVSVDAAEPAPARVAPTATYVPVCVGAVTSGWRNTAREFNTAWYDQATTAQRTEFATYVANAQQGRGLGSPIYANENICINPARVPQVTPTTTTTTTTTAVTTSTTTLPATTTTRPATTTTAAPTTTTTAATTSTTAATTSTSTSQPSGCTGSPGTPGSPDGQGGCFPGPGRVGLPAGVTLTPYTGPCTITTAAVLDARDFTGCRGGLDIRANNVTITRSKIYFGVSGLEGSGASFTIRDSLIDGKTSAGYACINCGVDGWNFTLQRVEIINTNRGAYCMKTCLIQDSWVHATTLQPIASNEAHASGIRVEQYATLIHNTIHCDYTGPFVNDEIGCSADMSGYADFAPIMHNTMTNNLFRANPPGSGFCAYGGNTYKPAVNGGHSEDPGNATYIVFQNNVFERGSNNKCGTYGPITDFASNKTGNVWTGNVWSNGGTVPPA